MALHDDPDLAWYGYIPSKAVTILFVTLYAISSGAHLFQAVKHRTWFMLGTALLCGVMEIVGWSSRVYSAFAPQNGTAYKIQISVLVLAPTPLLAANFVIFGRIIRQLGEKYSRLTPRRYTIVFTSCDILSLLIQSAGGGLAASSKDSASVQLGSHIILAGIITQAIIIVAFSFCAVEFFVRYKAAVRSNAGLRLVGMEERKESVYDQRPGQFTQPLRLLTCGLAFNTTVLFVRAVYRVIELAGGWDGRIMRTEVYFNVLDGAMIVMALYTTNFVHPGAILGSSQSRRAAVNA